MEAVCSYHPGNPAPHTCRRCNRLLCDVCEFSTSTGSLCADCITAGPSAEQRTSSQTKAVLSVVLAVVGAIVLIGTMVAAAVAPATSKGAELVYGLVFLLSLGAGAAGLSLGLISREYSRATGSVLPTVGVVANAILVTVLIGFAVVGVFAGQ